MVELLFILGNLSDSSQHQRISRTKSIHNTAIAGITIKSFINKALKKIEIKKEKTAHNTDHVYCSCQTKVHANRTGQKVNLQVRLS
jgi:hypothetical protein